MSDQLVRGSYGVAVEKLQQGLSNLGFYRGQIDSEFGPATFKAVREFQSRYFVDGIVDDHTLLSITKANEAWNTNEILVPFIPNGLTGLEDYYGRFSYKKNPYDRGWIIITDDWKDNFLDTVDLPIVGKYLINRFVKETLIEILTLIKDRGLDGEIKEFGCWAPRHKMHDPRRSLSTHSWGIAVDINQSTNGVGTIGDMDPGITQVFEQFGWTWGGRWRPLDFMHYQAVREY